MKQVEDAERLAQNRLMDKGLVIAKLRDHESELRAAGIVHLRIFGSVARGQSSTSSDVDLMADFDTSRRMTLIKVGRLQLRLSTMLGANVELSSAEWMREPIKSHAIREAVLAF